MEEFNSPRKFGSTPASHRLGSGLDCHTLFLPYRDHASLRPIQFPSMERLNKYLAHAGLGSRRHCETLILAGRVKIDGIRVKDLGTQIDPAKHDVSVDDHPVRTEKPVYWAVHKPLGYLCTNDDPAGRPRAIDLLPHVEQRVYTVGRLDESSEGLLLMTNDGELAFALMHPRFGIPKTYQVLVAGRPTPEDIQKLLDGVWLSEGRVRAREVRRMKPQGNSTWLRIVLTEGKNREIRRMLAKLNHKVLKLKRVAIGPVKLDKLPRAKARKVSESELVELRKWVVTAQEKITRLTSKVAGEQETEPAEKPKMRGDTAAKPTPKPRPMGEKFAKPAQKPKATGEKYAKTSPKPKMTGEKSARPTPRPKPMGEKYAKPTTNSKRMGEKPTRPGSPRRSDASGTSKKPPRTRR